MLELGTDWLISVDDHLFEPPTLWTDRLPMKYHDVGPRVRRIDGIDTWCYEETRVPMVGLSAVVGQSREEWSPTAINYDVMHPACWQPLERVRAMDQAGIRAQTNF